LKTAGKRTLSCRLLSSKQFSTYQENGREQGQFKTEVRTVPIYEYECTTCGLHFERRQSFDDINLPACPNGHDGVHRLFSAPGIVFKGSGWYVTDSRRAGASSGSD